MNFFNQTDLWIANWKWTLILATSLFSVALAKLLYKVIARVLLTVKTRTQAGFFQDIQGQHLETIFAWILVSFIWHAILDIMSLPDKVDKYLYIGIQIFQVYLIIRIAYKLADAVGTFLQRAAQKTDTSIDDQLVPLARKSLKIMVIVLGGLIALQSFGFNVVSLLAGLGLGGLALALAAQDTAANVFGSITIFLDKPFQVGDLIEVSGTKGIVEEIGFRSTSIRSTYNSLITIPNSVMAKEKIDNLGVRTSHQIRHVIGVTYDTSPQKLSDFMDSVKYTLHQNPLILKEDIRVNFINMGDFNLQILVQFFIAPTVIHDELDVQQEVLVNIMKIAEDLDVSFAFPTQTIHFDKSPVALAPAAT